MGMYTELIFGAKLAKYTPKDIEMYEDTSNTIESKTVPAQEHINTIEISTGGTIFGIPGSKEYETNMKDIDNILNKKE